jgi:hypothetical protein
MSTVIEHILTAPAPKKPGGWWSKVVSTLHHVSLVIQYWSADGERYLCFEGRGPEDAVPIQDRYGHLWIGDDSRGYTSDQIARICDQSEFGYD